MNKSGGILLNKKLNKVALVVRKGNEYSFPKGHVEENEEFIESAIREIIEETGYDVKLLSYEPIGIMKYNHNTEGEVINYMYLFIENGKTNKKIKEEDKESIVWVEINKVFETLTYQNLKDFWEEIFPKIKRIINK